MTRRILASYLVVALLIVVMLAVPLGLNYASRERERLLTAIERDSRVLAAEADDAFEQGQFDEIPALVEQYVSQTGGRVVMVQDTGRSVIDSDDPGVTGRDFSTRPEIANALAGRYTTGERDSSTLGESLSFVAVPIRHEGDVLGAVRVSYPTTTVDRRTRDVWVQLGSLAAVVLGVVGLLGWYLARTLARPIRDLEGAAAALASGDLAARVDEAKGPDDLRRVATTFNTMADRLQGLVESQRSFLADASHQLRTPLTAVRLRLESLAEADQGGDAASSDIAAISSEVDRLAELVDALLVMARLDALPGEVVEADSGAIAAERVDTWGPLADERDVRLVLDGAGAAPVLAIDGGLEQILDNLIANAVEVAPAGSTITVAVGRVGDEVRLSVADEGPGLTETQLLRAFDRFWRGPNPSDGGSGLGLAIVQRLAEASGGSVLAERLVPTGLRVVVTLRPAGAHTAP